MSRVSHFFNRVGKQVGAAQPNIHLDFGSQHTRVMVEGAVKWHQPTAVAWHQDQQAVVAIGERAAQLEGKTPERIQVIWPVQQGVVANLELAEMYLAAVLHEVLHARPLLQVIHPSLTVAIPSAMTAVESAQLSRVIKNVGAQARLLPKLKALVQLPVMRSIKHSHGIIDIGAQTVEVGFFTGQELVTAATLTDVAGASFTLAISEAVKKEYGCELGYATTEKVQQQIATVLHDQRSQQRKVTVRGKDLKTGTATTIRVEAAVFVTELRQLVDQLVTGVRRLLVMSQPELATQVLEQGIFITGGASQLQGLAQVLSEELGTQIVTSQSPELDVVASI